MAGHVDLSRTMVGTRSTSRAGWAAIAGVVIGAALLAGAQDPGPAASASRTRTPSVVHAASCPDGVRACADRRATSH
jgi:hypothetical protein